MAQKKRDEKEIEEVRKLLPKAPPPKVLEEMKRRQKAQKLVYRCGYYREPITGLKQKAALVHCTACGESYYLDYSVGGGGCHAGGYGDSFGFRDPLDHEAKITGNTCICPECGTGAEALHISHIRGTYIVDKTYFLTVHNIRGHFVALSWILFKECDKEANISYTIRRYEGNAIVGGRPIRYTGYVNGYYGYWSNQWDARAVWKDNCDEWDADEIFMNRADFDASDAAKSGLEEYIIDEQKKIRVGAYLRLWSKDPQIENLVRSGLSRILSQIIEKATTQSGYYYNIRRDFSVKNAEQYFDRKKVKPHEMLGIEKTEISLVKDWKIERLTFYKDMKARGFKLTEKQLEEVETVGRTQFTDLLDNSVRDFGFDPPPIRTLNYLVKQRNTVSRGIDAKYLFDYWNMTSALQNGLPPELLYPRNLEFAHDQVLKRKNEIANRATNEAIAEYAKKSEWLSFSDEETGLFIRAAQSQDELIEEGKALSHCVGSYAKAVARGETTILFIRRISAPEVPFFTLEFKHGKVQQNRGKRNCDRTQQVVAFEAKWIQHINEIKGDRKNGKRIRNQVAARQGAGA